MVKYGKIRVMRFFRDMFLSEGIRGRERRIKMRLKIGAGIVGVYCIAVPLFGSDPLEIVNAAVFKQRWMRKSDLLVVGLTNTLREAELLSAEILMKIYEEQGDYDTRSYFNVCPERRTV